MLGRVNRPAAVLLSFWHVSIIQRCKNAAIISLARVLLKRYMREITAMSDDRTEQLREEVVELQTQVAFQEQSIADLNRALADQQREIAAIKREWRDVRERYESLREQLPDSLIDANEKPPHY